ncbi:long-chain fatty acid--CoA ligase [Rhodococcus erythropolis]|uniref:AMP-dependent synthetase/ligase n=1 Tax=Rhodococcus erythropolis TaxID=1833 RepID=UPI001E44D0B5|nr:MULTISPECIES: long-chain fatty acid--CoA ligase [Rhodococcus erythropolis group]MCD2104815.1 long-chain fatty acid--CoA ligase [Rhodococcus qingshengii]MCZ4525057.1 long-chain fatty acid--CoA ligase [Rhodococcus erythropolis]
MPEFSAPQTFTIPEDASAVDSVFAFAKTKPAAVVYKRKVGNAWVDVTAGDFAAQVTAVAKGLIAIGVKQGDRVGLMSATRFEWPLVDYAIWAAGGVTVPIYETSAAEQVRWILEDSEAIDLIVENDAHAATVKDVAAAAPALRTVYQIEVAAGGKGVVEELTALGADVSDEDVHARVAALKASDPATLIYTSGTTGRPKGCQLTHSNLIAESKGILDSNLGTLLKTPGVRTLMFLPLAHVLARAVSIASFDAGAALGHTSDIPNLVPTFGEFKPDFILSVPRVFEKVYNSARAKAHGDGKGKIFDAAADTAVAWSEAQDKGGAGIVLKAKHALFDKLVYSKLRAALGGQCQLAISGGAPLGARLGHFFRGIGVTIYEGYGLTETTAAFAVNTIGAQKVGSVGKPLAGNSVRIAEDGEILLSGPVVFTGYWRNEKATAESIENGWFHTGDLGTVDKDGYITITGRKKEIIVTAGGKNVSPAQLEDSLRAHPLISQAIVVGDQKPFIGALITIDAEALPAWNERNNKAEGTTAADLVSDGELVGEIQDAIDEANKLVSHAEAIKKFRILPVDFSEDTGELTPTMKLKRNVVHASFAADIEKIYAK